jgi:hypothetical protein
VRPLPHSLSLPHPLQREVSGEALRAEARLHYRPHCGDHPEGGSRGRAPRSCEGAALAFPPLPCSPHLPQSPNVLTIFGVSVLPPRCPPPSLASHSHSVCIVLELCAFGSLADIVHSDRQRGKSGLSLSKADKLFLGLGCARCPPSSSPVRSRGSGDWRRCML